jgi:hypothetical protein
LEKARKAQTIREVSKGGTMKITLHAGPHSRVWCPVHVVLPKGSVPEALHLVEEATGQVVACQAQAQEDGVQVTWIVDELSAGATRTYALETANIPSGIQAVALENAANKVDVVIDKELFTSYNYSPEYARPFLYPVIGPYGHGITRNFPMVTGIAGETADHPHHRSLYTAFGEVNGVDDWSEGPGHGRIVHRRFDALVGGAVYGRIATQNDWVSQAGEKVVSEAREMTFYHTPADARLIDYVVTFEALDEPVKFGDTKEGGILSARVASSMDVSAGLGGQITNAYGGINEDETWGKPSPWCDYSGPVSGRTVGIALLDHPTNLRYPTQWHVRNYGLMTANCFGWSYYQDDKTVDGSHTMPAGSRLSFRYRVCIHSGGAERVAGRFLDFAFPPQVVVETG